LNRRSKVIYGAASCSSTTSSNTVAYTYDGGNRLTGISDSISGNITRQYDGLDHLTYESTPQGSVTYHTDAAGRRQDMTVTGQPIVTYTWDDHYCSGMPFGFLPESLFTFNGIPNCGRGDDASWGKTFSPSGCGEMLRNYQSDARLRAGVHSTVVLKAQ